MMKKALFIICLCVFSVSHALNNFIHRSGTILLDSNEKQIKLRGVNLGCWLLWEEWMWGGKFHSETHIMDALTEMTNRESAKLFREAYYLGFIREADIKKIASLDLNVVRIPVNCRIFDPLSDPSAYKGIGWQLLDSVICWCKKNGIYAVIDFHSAPGGQSKYFIADPEKELLWQSPQKQERAAGLWKAIAQRYKDNPVVAGYDLLNEPIPDRKANLVAIYQKMISAIRDKDKKRLIILEGADFAKDFSMFNSLPDENVAFSFHIYTWFGGDPVKKVKKFAAISKKLNVPMWCGEFGENNYEVIKRTISALEDAENNFSGWAFWTWKKVKNGYATLNGIPASDNWKKFMKAIRHKKKRAGITKQFALDCMSQFLGAIRFEMNKGDETLYSILKPADPS